MSLIWTEEELLNDSMGLDRQGTVADPCRCESGTIPVQPGGGTPPPPTPPKVDADSLSASIAEVYHMQDAERKRLMDDMIWGRCGGYNY